MKKTLLLLLVSITSFAQINVGDLVTRDEMKAYVDSVNKATKPSLPVEPIPVDSIFNCTEGPEIKRIFEVSNSSAKVQFHGVGVFSLRYEVRDDNGIIGSGVIRPTSNTFDIAFNYQESGVFKLIVYGVSCKGQSEQLFEVYKSESTRPIPVNGQNFELFLNTTGYGFDVNDPTGINKDWRERIEAHHTSWGYSITGVRILVRWYEWEPTIGEYKADALRAAAKYCQDRGLKFSVFFWPWRLENDGFIINNELVRGNHGSRHILEDRLVMGSLVSDYTNGLLYNAAKRIGEVMAEFPNSYYTSIGTANAEEFINPWIHVPYEINHQTGKYEHKEQPEIGGFEQISQKKFKEYLASKNRLYVWPDVHEWGTGVALNMNSENGKDFARFISLSLKNYFENFADAIKEGSKNKVLTAYTYPDVGSSQNAYHLHANFADQAVKADIMYGSDGNTFWDIDRKLVVNAVNKGFGKISMLEFDPEDIGQGTGRPDYCSGEIQYNVLDQYLRKTLDAGANVICFAMAYCPDEIRAMEPILKPYFETHFGHPYKSPNWPTKTIDIAPAYFGGMDMYAPHYNGNNFLIGDSNNFFGNNGQ